MIRYQVNFNCDFDGTCVTHKFPNMGKNIGAEFVLRELVYSGHGIILFTMRSDGEHPYLTDAVNWFQEHDIPLYGIQKNPLQHTWTSSPKSYANFMIDDSAIGCPKLHIPYLSSRPFVNWRQITNLLYAENIFTYGQLLNVHKEIDEFFSKEYSLEYFQGALLKITK